MNRFFEFYFDHELQVLLPYKRDEKETDIPLPKSLVNVKQPQFLFCTTEDLLFQKNYNAHLFEEFRLEEQRQSRARIQDLRDDLICMVSLINTEDDGEHDDDDFDDESPTSRKRARSPATDDIAIEPAMYDFYFLGYFLFRCNAIERKFMMRAVFKCPIALSEDRADEYYEQEASNMIGYFFREIASSEELHSANLDLNIGGDKSCMKIIAWLVHLPWYRESLRPLRPYWKNSFFRHSEKLTGPVAAFVLKWCCEKAVFREKYYGVTQTYYYRPTEDIRKFIVDDLPNALNKLFPSDFCPGIFWKAEFADWIQKRSNIFKFNYGNEEVTPEKEEPVRLLTTTEFCRWFMEIQFADLLFDRRTGSSAATTGVIRPLYQELLAPSPSNENAFIDTRLLLHPNQQQRPVPISIYKRCVKLDRENEELFESVVKKLEMSTAKLHRSWQDDIASFMYQLRSNSNATPEQLQQIQLMVENPVSFLYGPPGTGKTSQGVVRVVEFCNSMRCKIVCVAPTGKAFREMCRHLYSLPVDTSDGDEEKNGDNRRSETFRRRTKLEAEEEALADQLSNVSDGSLASAAKKDDPPLNIFQPGVSILERFGDDETGWQRPHYEEIRPRLFAAFGLEVPTAELIEYNKHTIKQKKYAPGTHPLQQKLAYHEYLSGTLQRFLFVFKRYNPDPHENLVLIVDEMSMVSAQLFHSLLQLIHGNRKAHIVKIIFCGDPNQLPSIGYGNVFNSLLESDLYTDFHRHYTRMLRQKESADALCNLMRALQRKIQEGTARIEIGFHADPVRGLDVVRKHHCKDSEDYYIREIINDSPHLILPCLQEDGKIVSAMAQVVTYTRAVKVWWNQCIQHQFDLWKQSQQYYPPGVDHRIIDKRYSKFFLYDKVRRKTNFRVSENDLQIQYFLANGDDAFIVAFDSNSVEVEFILDGKREVLTTNAFMSTFELAYSFTIHGSQGMSHGRTVMDTCKADIDFTPYDSHLFYVAASRPRDSLTMIIGEPSKHSFHNKRMLRCFSPVSPFLRDETSQYIAGRCTNCGQWIFSKSKFYGKKIQRSGCTLCNLA